ncbi:MAG: chemotaxis protein CheW [Ignavibacteria bacterium]|nr:chemotaxis protein CheW [Ignavibacteria bacterium]
MSNPNNDDNKKIVLFSLDEPRYALYLSVVERVVRAVEITPLPKAPEIVPGVINFHGEIITVIDMRRRFNLSAREIKLEDQLIVARTSKRLVALVVDSVIGIRELNHNQIVNAEQAFPFTDYLSGAAKIEGNLILITDLDKFLSLDEESKLEIATREMTDES